MADAPRKALQDRIDAIRARPPVASPRSPEPAQREPVRPSDLDGAARLVASILPVKEVQTWTLQEDGTWLCRETRERAAEVR